MPLGDVSGSRAEGLGFGGLGLGDGLGFRVCGFGCLGFRGLRVLGFWVLRVLGFWGLRA